MTTENKQDSSTSEPKKEESALKQLEQYYTLINPTGVRFTGHSVGLKESKDDKENIYQHLISILLGNSGRFSTATEMNKSVKDFSGNAKPADEELIKKVFKVYTNKDLSDVCSKKINGGGDSGAGVILSNSQFISLNVNRTNHVMMFMNTIPTVEIARAVPVMDVNFQFERKSYVEQPEGFLPNIPTTIKFLNESLSTVITNDVSKAILNSMNSKVESQVYNSKDKEETRKIVEDGKEKIVVVGVKERSETDMSIFTSPQTLFNRANKDARNMTVPLASLVDIKIDVKASPSYTVAYKTLKMNLILHDRSRLRDIADLVRPEIYSATTMLIRYGWSHPGNNSNPYAQLMNSMFVEERYAIKNASYTFDEFGQVKIILDFVVQGETDLWVVNISNNQEYRPLRKRLDELKRETTRLLEELGFSKEPSVRADSVIGYINHGSMSDVDDKELRKTIDTFLTSVKNRNAGDKRTKEAADRVKELLDKQSAKPGDNNLADVRNKIKGTVASNLGTKFLALETKKDPWIDELIDRASKGENANSTDEHAIRYASSVKTCRTQLPNKQFKYTYASLAKVMTTFMLEPLASTNKFKEVQIIFYPFNQYCGHAGGSNIAYFPINIELFKKLILEKLERKGQPDMAVGEFGAYLKDAFVADPSAVAYGMQNQYVPRTGKDFPKPKNEKGLESEQDKMLGSNPLTNGGYWHNPAIEFFMECGSSETTRNIDGSKVGRRTSDESVLRIHVYDRHATPWDGFLTIKESLQKITRPRGAGKEARQQVEDAYNVIEQDFAKNYGLNIKKLQEIKAEMDSGNTKTTMDDANIGGNNVFQSEMVKKFITSFVPSLYVGANNTGITKATVQSIQDPKLFTVNIMKGHRETTTSPNGAGYVGMPLRVIPGKITTQMIGCPLLTLNQQYFIDFGTNTDIDNVYGLTELSHVISQGKFETTAQFIWMDAYGRYEGAAFTLNQIKKYIDIAAKQQDKKADQQPAKTKASPKK